MKKTILIITGCVMLAISSFAKTTPAIHYTCYEVDGILTYDVTGCVPGSSIVFYSKPCGGHILKEVATDASGHASVAWTGEKAPAFVLNKPGAKGDKVSGNGMVAFTPEKEFSLGSTGLTTANGNTTIKWEATFSHPDLYVVDVLRSTNGRDYAVVKSVAAQTGAGASYTFSEHAPENALVSYKIRIRNAGQGTLFTSLPLQYQNQGSISVYPTIARSSINVRLPKNSNFPGTYRILDTQGKLQAEGLLSNEQSTVDVTKLPAGSYFIQVADGPDKTTSKFVKE